MKIEPGNTVEVLANGAAYPRLWADIRSARQTVTVQNVFLEARRRRRFDGEVSRGARTCQGASAAAARCIRLTGTQRGSGPTNLKKAGVEVAWLRPLHWYTLHKAATRSHVRVVVVDGRVGYTGGFGLADYWLGNGHAEDQWRESNARFEGPSVAQLQATFASGWAEATR